MKKVLKTLVGSAVFAFAAAPVSAASLISPSSVLAFSSEFPSGSGQFAAVNTINGSEFNPATGLHETYEGFGDSGGHWTTNTNDKVGAFITWGFSAPVDLQGVHIWNHPRYSASSATLQWFDASATQLGSRSGLALSNPTNTVAFGADVFAFTGMGVSSVKLTFDEFYADSESFAGLAEVRFELRDPVDPVAPIPVPAALPLMASAVGALALLRRRRAA